MTLNQYILLITNTQQGLFLVTMNEGSTFIHCWSFFLILDTVEVAMHEHLSSPPKKQTNKKQHQDTLFQGA